MTVNKTKDYSETIDDLAYWVSQYQMGESNVSHGTEMLRSERDRIAREMSNLDPSHELYSDEEKEKAYWSALSALDVAIALRVAQRLGDQRLYK